jgi:osmotically-inducible protein OsmY
VINDIRVQAIPVVTDADIAGAIRSALEADPQVPADLIQVQVDRGVVTLTGEVDWQYQRSAAENDARRSAGVHDVINRLTVRPRSTRVEEIRTGIGQALVRSAEVDAANIQVHVEGGHVTLRGTVQSRAERKEAGEAAWRAPGVTAVSNEIRVEPRPSPAGIEHVQPHPLREGMTVTGSDNRQVGKVEYIYETEFQLSRPRKRSVAVPFSAIQAVQGDEVQLSLPSAQVDALEQPPT